MQRTSKEIHEIEFVAAIVKEAEQLAKHRIASYIDYEHYKEILHTEGIFGHDYQIAEALKL